MADRRQLILDSLVRALERQGQSGAPRGDPSRLTEYPIRSSIDVVALAAAAEQALDEDESTEEALTPGGLNANNDG